VTDDHREADILEGGAERLGDLRRASESPRRKGSISIVARALSGMVLLLSTAQPLSSKRS
jgi:hypothetical protein